MANLVGIDPARKVNGAIRRSDEGEGRARGICGVPVRADYVKENNKRGSQHIHSMVQAGLVPRLISAVAHDEDCAAAVTAALDTQVGLGCGPWLRSGGRVLVGVWYVAALG